MTKKRAIAYDWGMVGSPRCIRMHILFFFNDELIKSLVSGFPIDPIYFSKKSMRKKRFLYFSFSLPTRELSRNMSRKSLKNICDSFSVKIPRLD